MKILKIIALFLSFYFVTAFLLPDFSFACCSEADCGGATCAGAGPNCKPQGSCTGGGTECGWGVGSNCPSGYSCVNGNCVGGGGSTGGGGGGNRGSCNWSPVNCPAGGTRTNEVVSVGCGTRCPAPGTAQATTGCCGEGKVDEEGVWYCGNPQVTTYGCCPAGTAPKETLVSGGSYTRDNGCSSPSCNDGDDLYIRSWGSSTECGRTCAYPDEERGCRGQEKIYTYGSYSLCQERHLEYSCVPTCDANAWGEWSACSATCGGGTQTRTNACGTPQSRTCNTQSCQGPWWQVKDGDITTNGDIVSRMPSGYYLDTIGSGGFPGVPVYKDQIGIAPGTISATLWNANTQTSLARIFNYSYFENLIPDDTVINDISKLTTGVGATTDASGYEWYKVTGNLDTVENIDLGSRKVILFVKTGNFNINGKINLDDNNGFFVVFVNGNINVAASVTGTPAIEGMYTADSGFSTGLGTSQLHLRGSIASFGGITMQRDLADDTVTPAELFEFAPDQVMLFPQKLMYRRTKWAEVAP